MTDLSSMIKYDFKLVTYTKSNGARSGLNGWWIVRWNPNTSISSYVPNGMALSVILVQYYVFNMSSQALAFLPQRMHEIAENRLEHNNTPFP